MEYKDYYKILGVERSASQDEIKRAYKKLARKYHPDVSKEKDAEARFKEVNEAYHVLRDKEKRKAYDQLGTQWQQGQEFHPPPGWEGAVHQGFSAEDMGGFSDFFSEIFGGRPGDFRYERHELRRRGEDLHAATDIHRLLQILLDLPAPLYHHHRLVTDESGRKLSKRHRDKSLKSLRQAGVSAREVAAMVGLAD